MDHRAAAEHSGLPQAVRLAMNAPIASTSGVARTLSRLRLPLLMCVSGFASLTYQMVWTAQGALWIGHESAAVLAVITAFFGGLAVGGLAFGKLAQHSANPTRWYGACELCIAAWGCILLAVGAHFQAGLQTLLESPAEKGFPWLTTFLLMFLWLLPATTAMGATLPAMQRLGSRRADGWHSLPELYACNTFGAVLGVLLPTFWLIPQFGFTRTLQVCIALNLACAASPLFLTNRDPTHGSSSHLGIGAITKSPEPESAWPHYITLAVTGFLGIAYEVLVVRVLSQVTEDTVYTFALLLSVYLVGTAVGAGAYQRFAATSLVTPARLRIRLLGATASACLVGTTSLWQSNWIRDTASSALGSSFPAAIATEALLAGCAFGPAAVAQGALFSHLSQSLIGAGANFGVALGMNTLAGSLAPILAGVVMATALGSKASLLWVAIGYVLLARPWGSARRELALWVPAACAMGLAVFAPPLSFLEVPEGGRVVSHEEGVMAAVSVVEDARGVARLSINNRQQEGSSASALVDARQAWIPLLLHPHPRRALFLGLGTGVTARAASRDQNLEVDAVELLPEVIEAAHHFRSENDPAGKPRVFEADARRYIRSSRSTYDVIVSDNFHPARSGSGALYTVEHFAAVRRVLNERGLFCQWLPLHQLDLDTLRSIVQSFVSVYPRSWALLANNSLETPVLGLLTKADQTRLDLTLIRERLLRATPQELLHDLGLVDEYAALGGIVAGPEALRRFAGAATRNTDDHPVVAYSAPRITYAPVSSPRERLMTLLQALEAHPDELLMAAPERDADRLIAYWNARNRFIELGRNVRPAPDVESMLRRVRDPLLSVLRISRDFRPAYDPLLSMAVALSRSDAESASWLLAELQTIQPARREASRALAELAARPRRLDVYEH